MSFIQENQQLKHIARFNKSKTIYSFLVAFISVSLGVSLLFQVDVLYAKPKNQNGYQIMKKVYAQYTNYTSKQLKAKLIIYNSLGSSRSRSFLLTKEVTNYNKKKLDRTVIEFTEPKSVIGTRLISVKDLKSLKTDQWIYLPAFKKTKKISVKDQNNSFMGSDFIYADISGRSLESDTHKLTKTDDLYYYITSYPKDKKDIYSKLLLKVHKKYMLPVTIQFFNKSDKKIRTLYNNNIQKNKTFYIATHLKIENHVKNQYSEIKFYKKVKTNIPDSKVKTPKPKK